MNCPACDILIEEEAPRMAYPGQCSKELILKEVVSCANCSAGVAFPLPGEEEIEKFYVAGNYWKENYTKLLLPQDLPGYYAVAKARWNFIRPHILAAAPSENPPAVRMLDIGAGHGFMGTIAAQDFRIRLQQYGVTESDRRLLDSLRNTWGKLFASIPSTFAESLKDIHSDYHLVILSHIVEHLSSPRNFIKQVSDRMTQDGLLFIEVPHEDQHFKPDVFPHVLFLNPRSLRHLVESLGFEVREVACYGRKREVAPFSRTSESLGGLLAKVLYRGRSYLPSWVGPAYYGHYFGAGIPNADGTWVRLIASKK